MESAVRTYFLSFFLACGLQFLLDIVGQSGLLLAKVSHAFKLEQISGSKLSSGLAILCLVGDKSPASKALDLKPLPSPGSLANISNIGLQEILLKALNREALLLKHITELVSQAGDQCALADVARWALDHKAALDQVYGVHVPPVADPLPPRRRRGRPKKLPVPPKPARRHVGFAGILDEKEDLSA